MANKMSRLLEEVDRYHPDLDETGRINSLLGGIIDILQDLVRRIAEVTPPQPTSKYH